MADLKRIDPPSRSVDGANASKITNKRPDRWYILANPNDDACGVEAMREYGFEVETARKDGPRISGGATAADGSVITWRGQVLMSCPLDVYLERYNAGQQRSADIERRANSRGGVDGLIGPTGKPAFVEAS